MQGKKAKLIKEGGEFDEDKFQKEVFVYTVVKNNFSVARCRNNKFVLCLIEFDFWARPKGNKSCILSFSCSSV